MVEPLVSVVLPTFNRAHSLPRAMGSVLAQSLREIELIVVDDGSTDDTERVVAAAAAADPRVRYVRRVNGGPAAARNTGLREARGEFVAFQDSDDEWLTTKLARQLEVLRGAGPDAAMCVCSYLVTRPRGEAVRGFFLGEQNMAVAGDLSHQLLVNFYFPTPSWLVRRAALAQAGEFDEQLRCWEDWELALRLSGVGKMLLVDEALYVQHVTAGSVNRQDAAYGPALRRILEKHAGLWADHPRILAEHLYVVGRHEMRYGSREQARRYFREATRRAPRFRKAWAALWISLLGRSAFETLQNLAGLLRRWTGPGEYVPEKIKLLDYIAEIHGHELTKSQRRTPDL